MTFAIRSLNCINRHLAACGMALLLAGYLGYRLIQWMTNSSTEGVDKRIGGAAQQTFEIKQTPSTQQVELIAKTAPISTLAIPAFSYNNGKVKNVYIIQGTDFVLKVPRSPTTPNCFLHWEYFAYLISESLQLHAVPFVALINAQGLSDQEILQCFPGLEKLLSDRFGTQCMMLQTKIPNSAPERPSSYNLENIHRLLFFNLIAGRGDTKTANSMIDEKENLWEVDNDDCGGSVTLLCRETHWLRFHGSWKAPISTELLDHILSLDCEACINPLEEKARKEAPDTYKAEEWGNIKQNLMLIQQGIQNLKTQGSEITIEKLTCLLTPYLSNKL